MVFKNVKLPIVENFVVRKGNNRKKINSKLNNLYNEDINPIVNYLGEHYDKESEAINDAYLYCTYLLEWDRDERPIISVKPTQIGLQHSKDLFNKNIISLVEHVKNNNGFMWIDMESYDFLEDTIDGYKNCIDIYDEVGLCLQANIKRTETDLESILDDEKGYVRLVKGAYKENEDVAFTDKNKVDKKYKQYIQSYNTDRLHLGTHDNNMINLALKNFDTLNLQMLMGVREEYQKELACKNNCNMYQYVPYGNEWFSYFYRRIRENKSNVLVGLKNLR